MSGNRGAAISLAARLRLPAFGGPMFIASTPALVIAQCKAGILGSMPALNARSPDQLDEAIDEIKAGLSDYPDAAPWSINLVAHRSNDRLEADFALVLKHRAPVVIVSLAASTEIVAAVHGYGGLVFNDIISDRHGRKCAEAGVDGLIAVAAGAGGHTGNVSPFALVHDLRRWWDGPLALAGCIATGHGILAAQVMGADFGYVGSLFLVAEEANTSAELKNMLVAGDAADIVITNCFTGVNAAFLRPSIMANGLDPDALVRAPGAAINIKDGGMNAKAWRDIWSAGQGIGAIGEAAPAAALVERLIKEYEKARGVWEGEAGRTLTRP